MQTRLHERPGRSGRSPGEVAPAMELERLRRARQWPVFLCTGRYLPTSSPEGDFPWPALRIDCVLPPDGVLFGDVPWGQEIASQADFSADRLRRISPAKVAEVDDGCA